MKIHKKFLKTTLACFLNLFLLISFFIFTSCIKWDPKSARDVPTNAGERARQNIETGRGVSLGGIIKGRGNTSYEFSSSNPMWRASLETLDFLPFSVVDYSGGMLVTDWYSDSANSGSSIKITLRFLSNEVRSDSLKITVHEKKCSTNSNCKINILDSRIKQELLTSILKKAALLDKQKIKK